MTRYDIRLALDYRYEEPVAGSRQHLRVQPLRIDGIQTVLDEQVTIDPAPAETGGFTDFFGNPVCVFALRDAHERLSVTMRASVEVTRPEPEFDVSPQPGDMARILAGLTALGPASPHHFLGAASEEIEPKIELGGAPSLATAYAARHDALTAWAGESLAPPGGQGVSVQRLAQDLAQRIHREFAYDGFATDVTTTAAHAFSLRRGVCQDFAHVMIAALRGLGVPAGYVSGLLRTEPPPGQARLEGADAMHAWVRVWCGHEAGWREFDPTNGIAVADGHIAIAHGRDYDDAAPIIGVLKTAGAQEGWQSVDVLPAG